MCMYEALRIVGVTILFSLGMADAQTPPSTQPPTQLQAFKITENAIAAPLGNLTGDAARGRAIVANRQVGLCLLCHAAPITEERFQGNLAPTIDGVGSRLSEGQIRMRMVDSRQFNPQTIMPSYYSIGDFARVGSNWKGQTILNAQQIEDVVAYLVTLRGK